MTKILFLCLSLTFSFLCMGGVEYPLVPMPKKVIVSSKNLLPPGKIVLLSDPGALPAVVFNQSLKNHGLPQIAVRKKAGDALAVIRFATGAPAPAEAQGYAVSVKNYIFQ